MPRRRRLAAAGFVVAAAVPVLSACSTSPGAAALVGSHRISTGQLQSETTLALANPAAKTAYGANRGAFSRAMLGHLISDDVVEAAAKAYGVSVTSAQVATTEQEFIAQIGSLSALQSQAAQGGVPPSRLQAYIRTYALEQSLADAVVAKTPVPEATLAAAYQKDISQFQQVDVAHILVTSKSLAQHLLAEVRKDPSRFAALAAQYSTDTGSKNNGGALGYITRSSVVKAFGDAAFTAAPGSYVLAHSQYGYHVIHVIARRTESLAQATPALKTTVLSSQKTALLTKALVTESRRLHISVSPRYGTWSAAKETVVAAKDTISSAG